MLMPSSVTQSTVPSSVTQSLTTVHSSVTQHVLSQLLVEKQQQASELYSKLLHCLKQIDALTAVVQPRLRVEQDSEEGFGKGR